MFSHISLQANPSNLDIIHATQEDVGEVSIEGPMKRSTVGLKGPIKERFLVYSGSRAVNHPLIRLTRSYQILTPTAVT